MVLSFPGPDRSIRLKDLKVGKAVSRRYRNRRIGEFLKELELTEGRSTGIPKILKVMRENGSPPPEFETDEDRTFFLIRLPVHTMATKKDAEKVIGKDTLGGGVKPGLSMDQVGTKLALSRHQVEILHKCLINAGITELMEIAKRKDRTKFRDQVLNPLLEAGLIKMTIPGKPTSPNQKYRLTEKARKLMAVGDTKS